MFAGFQEVVISVFNIPRFAEAFVEIGGYGFRQLGDAPPEQCAAWRLPLGCRIEQALLTPENDEKGCVRLVRFHGMEQRVMRSSQHGWDTGGIFDIDVYTVDARGSYSALQRLGWTGYGEPLDYRLGDFEVCEVLAVGPAGVNVALIQAYSPPLIDLPKFRGWSRAFNSAQIVGDYRRAFDFYTTILGWRPLIDLSLENEEEPAHSILGIPRPYAGHTPQDIGILHPEGTNDGSIELIALRGIAGRNFAAHCVAPNVGYLCYRFPVVDLTKHAETLLSRGAALYAPPSEFIIEPLGRVHCCSVRSPDGVILEFFEVLG